MKRLTAGLCLSATLAACGGGDHIAEAKSSVPDAVWSVSYPQIDALTLACYPTAMQVTFTDVQPDGHAKLFVDGVFVGDPAVLVAAMPSCTPPVPA